MSEIVPASPELAPLPVAATDATAPAEQTAAEQDQAQQPAPEQGETERPRDPQSGRFTRRTEQLQSTISNLTATKHQLSREIEMLTQRAERLRSQPLPEPTDPYDAQHAARSALRQERYQETVDTVRDLTTRVAQIRADAFHAKIEAAAVVSPDIRQSAQAFLQLPLSEVAAELIVESDKAAILVDHFAKNPDVARHIASLAPYRQAAEIAKLEVTLAPAQPKRVSKAPAPVQTVSGGSGNSVPELGAMTMEQYAAHRMKQMAGR